MNEENTNQTEQTQTQPLLSPATPVDPIALAATLSAKAEAGVVAALVADAGSGGQNCRFVTGYYDGDGNYGSRYANRLRFPFRPKIVLVVCQTDPASMVMIAPGGFGQGIGNTYLHLTWEDNYVSWFNNTNALSQGNKSGCRYYYAAFGTEP